MYFLRKSQIPNNYDTKYKLELISSLQKKKNHLKTILSKLMRILNFSICCREVSDTCIRIYIQLALLTFRVQHLFFHLKFYNCQLLSVFLLCDTKNTAHCRSYHPQKKKTNSCFFPPLLHCISIYRQIVHVRGDSAQQKLHKHHKKKNAYAAFFVVLLCAAALFLYKN